MDIRSNKGYSARSPFNREPANKIKGDGRITMSSTKRKLVAMDGQRVQTLSPGQEAQFQGNVLEMDPAMLFELESPLLEAHLKTLKVDQQSEFIEKYQPLPENMKRAALMQIAQMHQDLISQITSQISGEEAPEGESEQFMQNGGRAKPLEFVGRQANLNVIPVEVGVDRVRTITPNKKGKVKGTDAQPFMHVQENVFYDPYNKGFVTRNIDGSYDQVMDSYSYTQHSDYSKKTKFVNDAKNPNLPERRSVDNGNLNLKFPAGEVYLDVKQHLKQYPKTQKRQNGGYEQVQAPTDGYRYTGIVPNKLTKDNTITLSNVKSRARDAGASKKQNTEAADTTNAPATTKSKLQGIQEMSDKELEDNYEAMDSGPVFEAITHEISRRSWVKRKNARDTPPKQVDPFIPNSLLAKSLSVEELYKYYDEGGYDQVLWDELDTRIAPPVKKAFKFQARPEYDPFVVFSGTSQSIQAATGRAAPPPMKLVSTVADQRVVPPVPVSPAFSVNRLNWNPTTQHTDKEVQDSYEYDSPFRGNESTFTNRKK